MEPETSPLCNGASMSTAVLVMAVTDRRVWENIASYFVLYCSNFLSRTCISFRDMGTKNKKERNQRRLLPWQFQEADGRWTHIKKLRRKEETKKRWKVYWVIKKIDRNTFYKIFNQWYKHTYIHTYIKGPAKNCFFFFLFLLLMLLFLLGPTPPLPHASQNR